MKFLSIMILAVLVFLSSTTLANKSSRIGVSFNNPEKFTDFKTRINLGLKDRERLMKQLRGLIQESTLAVISSDYKMEITVNNMDMAGAFLYGNSDLVRIVRDSDRIRFEFSYRLFDKKGKLLKAEDVNLSNRGPRLIKRRVDKYKHTHFIHEMPLYDKWLKSFYTLGEK